MILHQTFFYVQVFLLPYSSEDGAFELLFKQLNEDLKNDYLSIDDIGDEITGKDMALLKRELESVLGDCDDKLLNSYTTETLAGNDDHKISKDGNDNSLNLTLSRAL